MKDYTYKGLKFRISEIAKPAEDDIVYFTSTEWSWIKPQSLDHAQFKVLWQLKKQDHRHSIIPQKDLTEAARLANHYCANIINGLRGKHEGKQEE